jgi:hypothetical protein
MYQGASILIFKARHRLSNSWDYESMKTWNWTNVIKVT